MRLKRFLLNLLILPFLLTGCNSFGNYHGVYSFQLGNIKTSHMYAGLTLGNKKTPTDTEESFSLQMEINLDPEQGNSLGFGGTYNFDNEIVDGKKKLNLTVSNITIKGESIDIAEIPTALLELFFVAYLTNKTINIILPVSIEEFECQFYWYGFDIWKLEPVEEHPIGTHPTKEEVIEIQQTKQPNFRDWHCLTWGLKYTSGLPSES